MSNATMEKAIKLAVVTGLRTMLGPALLARAHRRPGHAELALAAIGEMILDKQPLMPRRDSLLPLVARGLAGAWVARRCYEDDGIHEPWAGPLGAIVAIGTASAAPRIRQALGWTLGIPDPLIGLAEDAFALKLGADAVGLSLEDLEHAARESFDRVKEQVLPAPQPQSAGAGSM
jgi:uncharacterized membrane protein